MSAPPLCRPLILSSELNNGVSMGNILYSRAHLVNMASKTYKCGAPSCGLTQTYNSTQVGLHCPRCGWMMSEDFGGCFIATAAYGNELDSRIDVLRTWREVGLRKNMMGRAFIRIYYSISPPVANIISKSNFLRFVVRTIIYPLVWFFERKYSRKFGSSID